MAKYLYEKLESGLMRCSLCGKEIYPFGYGYFGLNSHARKHVREGTVREIAVHSARGADTYDRLFLVKEVKQVEG